MKKFKACCTEYSAQLVRRLPTITQTIDRKTGEWDRGLYQCQSCGKYSIRGEKNSSAHFWGTYVESIGPKRAVRLVSQL